LLLAVSGGADSMAMLASLCALRKTAEKRDFFCLHVEHGIRRAQESCGDAEFVRSFCKKNDIKCRIVHITPGKIAEMAQRRKIGIEAAARFFRHKILKKYAAKLGSDTLILLGHTKDDLLELALMRILRGAGPAGLAVMPKKRGRIIRPLLDMSKNDVIQYLKDKNISYREDSTNTDTQFLRNRIRGILVPILNKEFPFWKTGTEAMAKTQDLAADFITREAGYRIKWDADFSADAENFFAQMQIIREEAVFIGINALCDKPGKKSIRRSVVRKFCTGLINSADLGSIRIKLKNGRILLQKKQKEFFESGILLPVK